MFFKFEKKGVVIVNTKQLYNGKVEIFPLINGSMAEILVKLKKPGIYNLGKASCKSTITVIVGRIIIDGVVLEGGGKTTILEGKRIDVQTDVYSEYKMETDKYHSK